MKELKEGFSEEARREGAVVSWPLKRGIGGPSPTPGLPDKRKRLEVIQSYCASNKLLLSSLPSDTPPPLYPLPLKETVS